MAIATASVSSTRTANRRTVHSAGSVRDGKAICACDKPAARIVSHSERNPDRPYYCCADHKCRFWKWEDDLLAAGLNPPPQPPAPPQTPNNSRIVTKNSGLPSPISSAVKRSHAQMAEHMTPEAKARRLAAIQDAVGDLSPKAGSNISGNEDDRGNFNREGSTSDEEDSTPGAKRTRFSVKKEEEEGTPKPGTTGTPPRRSRPSVTLPTPLQTSEREGTAASQGIFSGELPPSPTSFTKGAQRAMERARAQSSASGSGLQADKGKARAVENDGVHVEPRTEETNSSIPGPSSNKPNGQQEQDGPGDVQMQDLGQDREESFPSQLASTIQKSAADMQEVASNLRNRNPRASPATHSAAATTIFNSMSTIFAQQTSMYSAVHGVLADSERLRRRVDTAERSLTCKDTQIAKLQEENAELKTRNTELEAMQEQIRTIAKNTPPRSVNTSQD